jgi:hypothetical protein
MSDGGKGSSPRPFSVDQKTFANNYDAIFRKPDAKQVQDSKNEDDEFERIEKENSKS